MTDILQQVTERFVEDYGEEPSIIVRAPGRVNLIGEHTDYNDGFVMPMAINRAVVIALRPRMDRTVHIRSLDFDQPITFALDGLQKGKASPTEYVKGVAWALQEDGYDLVGFEGIMKGDVPIGSGLSSSAALEMAAARAFLACIKADWQPAKIALLGQKVENKWMGVNSGIMDQMISAAGVQDHAVLIDCRSLEIETLRLPPGTAVLILDTSTRRGLVDSAYNERRQQCEAAAEFFGVTALRDVSVEMFEANADGLDPLIRQRAKHIVYENARVLEARDAMLKDDAEWLGRLMDASHISLRDDYEVSSDALNALVDITRKQAGVYGARMTGAGFGGCAVALVDAATVEHIVAPIAADYKQKTGYDASIYVTEAANGAEVLKS
ncbi:MAG: galactokinase [Anaerolineae bacterium]|nr:galactokinase [Anaerolineae bacterium]